jgi:hypothetical protein
MIPAHAPLICHWKTILIGWICTACLIAGEIAPPADALLDKALGGDTNAASVWTQQVPHLDEVQARRAIDAIRATASRQHHDLLIGLIQHPEPWVRRRALETLAALGSDGSNRVEQVLARLDDPTPLVREAAASTLVAWNDASVWPDLINRLNDSDPEKIRLAHTALQQQSHQSLPPNRQAWEDWMQTRTDQETALFAHFQSSLTSGSGSNAATAINGLASLDLMRKQTTSVLLGLVNDPNPQISSLAERYLRQWTGCDGAVPLDLCLQRARSQAVEPPALRIATPAKATNSPLPRPSPPLSSTMRTLILVTILAGILTALVWFLRTPAGRKTKLVTRRYIRPPGAQTAMHAIRTGTRRFTKPIDVNKAAKDVVKDVAKGTQRIVRSIRPK